MWVQGPSERVLSSLVNVVACLLNFKNVLAGCFSVQPIPHCYLWSWYHGELSPLCLMQFRGLCVGLKKLLDSALCPLNNHRVFCFTRCKDCENLTRSW